MSRQLICVVSTAALQVFLRRSHDALCDYNYSNGTRYRKGFSVHEKHNVGVPVEQILGFWWIQEFEDNPVHEDAHGLSRH